ncbi:MAG: GDP-mannose 4,6-dehydratase [Chitinispirillia bacterium]|jgi:GDPmannose 4,6-dehydratase
MQKIALITGIGGQDGSYLVELLLEKGYDIHGVIRRTSQFNRNRIEKTRNTAQKLGQKFELHYGDLSDSANLFRIIFKCQPTEIYNLASQSHVAISFEEPEYTTDINSNGVLRLLEGIRHADFDCRFYQASTSELFGKVSESPQDENTMFYPRSPYGVSKLYAYWIVKNYRESYGIHSSNGILFNHESPRRGENFVTRKITYSLARIRLGIQDVLRLGNLDARRDWGYAKDYVKAMWLILQQEKADDYIIATGKVHSVRDFINKAALIAGFELEWNGKGIHEVGMDRRTGKVIVEIDPRYYRPSEVEVTCGDATKAREVLGWQPEVSFDQLVEIMMENDLKLLSS